MTKRPFNTDIDNTTRRCGLHYEAVAEHYLSERGLLILRRNFRARCGEIDLVMQDAGMLVFVEVRYRHNASHGSAIASVTRKKQSRLMRTATLYLKSQGLYDKVACRFDIVGIQESGDRQLEITWVQQAFP